RTSIIPWTRFPLLIGTAYALAHCARAWRAGRPDARLHSFAAFFGLLLPQTALFMIYLSTLRGVPWGVSIPVTLAVWGALAAGLGSPAMLRRFQAAEAGLGWASLRFGHRRVLATIITLAWLGVAAEVCVGLSEGQILPIVASGYAAFA